MKLARIPGALGKGLVAGFAGTLAMTASSTIEMKLRGRKASDAPARAAEEALGVTPVGEDEKKRFSNLVHFGYGTAWGAPRGALSALGLPEPVATVAHFGAVWGGGMAMLPALDVAPPPTEWSAKEIAVDGWHHLVYALATGLTYRVLNRWEDRSAA